MVFLLSAKILTHPPPPPLYAQEVLKSNKDKKWRESEILVFENPDLKFGYSKFRISKIGLERS